MPKLIHQIATLTMTALMLLAATGVTFAQTYGYTIVARRGQVIGGKTLEGFQPPSLNNAGQVAFTASIVGGGNGVFTGTGLVAATGQTIGGKAIAGIFGNPWINDSGQIAYVGTSLSGNGIFIGSNLAIAAGGTIGGQAISSFAPPPFIDNSGRLLFTGNNSSIFTPTAFIASGFSARNNDAGQIVYVTSDNKRFATVGLGGTSYGANSFVDGKLLRDIFSTRGSPSINNSRQIAFWAAYAEGAGINTGIFTSTFSGTPPAPVTTKLLIQGGQTIGGVKLETGFAGDLSLNDSGKVAFTGSIVSGTSWIFTQDSVVIGPGTVIDGKTVVIASNPIINNGGQIVFIAVFADGTTAIVLATPGGVSSTLQISTSLLPSATSEQAYSTNLTATGGSGSGYTWAIASGTLPTGFALSLAGVLSSTGTPVATAGTYPITFRVTDSASSTVTKALTLSVQPGIQITTTTLPDAATGVPYTATLTASGGTGTGYTWSLASGTLPPGFTLLTNAVLGTTGATPAPAQSYGFTVKVTDSANNTATKLLSLVVNPSCLPPTTTHVLSRAPSQRSAAALSASPIPTCLTISSANLAIESGNRYTTSNGPRISPTGGTPPYVWQLTFPAELTNAQFGFSPFGSDVVITAPGSLGKSQTLPNGVLPVRPSSYTIRAAVSDATDQVAFLDLTLTVSCKESSNDLDGDSLPDCWEVFGIDVDEDGVFDYALPTHGSQYDKKDIFVEIDAMEQSLLPLQSIDMLRRTFSDHQVTLHLDDLPSNGAHVLPQQTIISSLGSWFTAAKISYFGSQSEVNERNRTGNPKPLQAKALAYHYCIMLDQHPMGAGGTAEIGGNDFVVTSLFPNINSSFRAKALASAFMHELGHNLGLRHGGGGGRADDDVTRKPNYLSIMNYARAYELPALGFSVGSGWRLDYSSRPLLLEDLNEQQLVESRGVRLITGGVLAQEKIVFVKTPGDTSTLVVASSETGIDWDQSAGALLTIPYGRDITGDRVESKTLHSYSDWDNLAYNFRACTGPKCTTLAENTVEPEETLDNLARQTGDPDGDGIYSLYDSCPYVSNSDQADRDGNGVGDKCQAPVQAVEDVNQDGEFDCNDVVSVRNKIGARQGDSRYTAAVDVNRDGVIDVRDVAIVSRAMPPGTIVCR